MARRKESREARFRRYESLTRRLEVYAERHPAGYCLRVLALYALGVGYAAFWLVAAIALLVAIVTYCVQFSRIEVGAIRLIIVLAVAIGLIVRSFWVPMPPIATGIALTRENASAIFALVDDIRGTYRVPKIHHVRLDGQFNAYAAQRPRFGLFGGARNYLVLGLPLMDALSPDQFRFVVAHELGHHSRNHSRIGRWVYTGQNIWAQLSLNFQDESGQEGWIFGKFYRWFVPYFSAYSYALRRQSEFEADQFAVNYTTPQSGGSALAAMELRGRWLEERFWKPFGLDAAEHAELPESVYLKASEMLKQDIPSDIAEAWLASALRSKTDYSSSHPCLSDRLRAIGYAPSLYLSDGSIATPPSQNSAQVYFGTNLPYIRRELEEEFRRFAAEGWKAGHEEAQEIKRQATALEEKEKTDSLSVDEALALGSFYERLHQLERAKEVAYRVLARHPDNVHATFHLGRMLLEAGQEEGRSLIENAMERDGEYVLYGCRVVYDYLREIGKDDEAETYRSRYYAKIDLLEEMDEERKILRPNEVLHAARMESSFVAEFRQFAEGVAEIEEALIVRKQVKASPEIPCYYVFLKLGMAADAKNTEKAIEIMNRVQAGVKWQFQYYMFTSVNHNDYYRRIQRVDGATVYKRRGA